MASSRSARISHLLFLITYHSLYFLLCLLLTALLLVTPGDAIRQALLDTHQLVNVLIIAAVLLLTIIIVLFIYSLRLYITRTILAGIPKNWVPIEKGDVGKDIRKVIQDGLERSASIAWQARPKASTGDGLDGQGFGEGLIVEAEDTGEEDREKQSDQLDPEKESLPRRSSQSPNPFITQKPRKPMWGDIQHPGWGTPNSPDLPNLQYSTVIGELSNLIEAKAVSLAPVNSETNALDAEGVALLQRPLNMDMRGYLAHLASLGVLTLTAQEQEFVDLYERARFGGRPLRDIDFRRLMHLFAELLRAMAPINMDVLDILYGDSGSSLEPAADDAGDESDSNIDDDAPRESSPTTPARSISSSLGPEDTGSARPGMIKRNSSALTWHQYRTAPTTPKSQRLAPELRMEKGPSDSPESFSQSRRPYPVSQPSSASLRSFGRASQKSGLSGTSKASQGSEGSVIRLKKHGEAGDLPYVLGWVEK